MENNEEMRIMSWNDIRVNTVAVYEAWGLDIRDMEHSHVSLLTNEGSNIQEVARRLGHANARENWNTCCHLYPREEERAVEILDKIIPK